MFIINDNQIPLVNNKNSAQKLGNIHSHHPLYHCTQKKERPRYPESKLHARKATTHELEVLNLYDKKKPNSS